jgi:hypothetical protein
MHTNLYLLGLDIYARTSRHQLRVYRPAVVDAQQLAKGLVRQPSH